MNLLRFMWLFLMPQVGLCQNYSNTKKLKDSLFANYDKTIRPVIDQKRAVPFSFAFSLVSLLEVDEINQVVSIQGYLIFQWTDELLSWNQSEHDNIPVLNPASDSFWYPAFIIDNSVTGLQGILDPDDVSQAALISSGRIFWFPVITAKVHCKLIMTKFPYDSHTCTFVFSPRLYLDHELNMTVIESETPLADYTPHGEWELLSLSTAKNSRLYKGNQAFSRVNFTMTIRRRPDFFVLNLLFPTCALSFLSTLVFILPANSGEKTGYSITVLLSVMLFMGTTSSVLPRTSDVVPLITQYLTWLTIISILSVIASIVTLLVHHSNDENERKKAIIRSVLNRLREKIARKSSKSRNSWSQSNPTTSWQRKVPVISGGLQDVDETTVSRSTNRNDILTGIGQHPVHNTFEFFVERGDNDIKSDNDKHKEQDEYRRFKPSASSGLATGLASHQAISKREINEPKTGIEFLSSYLEIIFFITFLLMWITVTISYLLPIFI